MTVMLLTVFMGRKMILTTGFPKCLCNLNRSGFDSVPTKSLLVYEPFCIALPSSLNLYSEKHTSCAVITFTLKSELTLLGSRRNDAVQVRGRTRWLQGVVSNLKLCKKKNNPPPQKNQESKDRRYRDEVFFLPLMISKRGPLSGPQAN